MDLTGRRLRGFVAVRPEDLKSRGLKRWVGHAVVHAQTLPVKTRPQKE